MTNINFKKVKLLALDFDGVMTNNLVLVDENGKESVMCSRSDSLGIEILRKKLNIDTIVISKETNKVIKARCKKLNIECFQAVDDKITLFKKEINKRKLIKDEVCFIGNDINDIDCIKHAGIGICVNDGYQEVKNISEYITTSKGGNGAIREVVDLIIKSHI